MKPKVVIGVLAIIGFTSLLMLNFSSSISTYVNFEEAESQRGSHVVGTLDQSREFGFSMEEKKFTFYMKDQDGNVRRVVYPKPKPNNFEQADQLVVIGEMQNGVFYADEMLMKCPSKYNNLDESQFEKAVSENS